MDLHFGTLIDRLLSYTAPLHVEQELVQEVREGLLDLTS